MNGFMAQDVVKGVLAPIPNGQFFTVIFEKKDGTLRKMVCQKGVRKHTNGGKNVHKDNDNIQGVYEKDKQGYRCFYTDKVLYIKAQGSIHSTNDPVGSARLAEFEMASV